MALAAIVGAEAAAEQLGWDRRSVRKWSEAAGHRPELDGNAEAWQRAFDLAHAKVEGFLASGKVSPVMAATVMGIAQRNLRDLERDARRVSDPSGSAVAAYDEFTDWLVDTTPIDSEEALEATVAAIRAVTTMLLRLANAEADPYAPPSPHRVAILAWHSGRPEVEAGDIVEWSKAQVAEVIAEHSSLIAWHEHQQAEDAAEQARRDAEIAEIEIRAAAARSQAEQAIHDGEARARLAAAALSRPRT